MDSEAGFDPDQVIPVKDRKKMDRFIQFAVLAAEEALAQAGWKPETEADRERTATVIASGVGGFPAMMEAAETVRDKGPRRLSPFTVPSFLVNLAAGQVSIRHGFKGPLGAPTTACAASVQALGDAARLIRAGEADIAVAGGAEACIDRVSLAGFAAARALSTGFNDEPEKASRPFDADRDGFVMGEGAGILVIEDLDHARARGATPLAEILGYGTSADAYHMTAGPEDGDGARRAISATKSATGHLLGAAGGLEAIFTLLALRDGALPPTLNLNQPDPLADGLDLVGPEGRRQPTEFALSNGFGFGGVNASIVLKRWT
jgi:3-oxoacyl-[acyl-carrier-protein] synthase II